MRLAGQANAPVLPGLVPAARLALERRRERERGYAMAALLVAVAVMGVLLSAALPVWSHEMRREKEAELIFRGEQYVRAIGLFQRRYPGAFPPNLDVLVQQRFLRKKYKDPITGDDFQLVTLTSLQQGSAPGTGVRGVEPGRTPVGSPAGRSPLMGPGTGAGLSTAPPGSPGLPAGGIVGVASKSRDTSIRIYKGRTRYNEWPFVYAGVTARPGGPGQLLPGAPGRPGQPA
ncbi:MAG TPA: hypothetical protein VNI83_10830, partial [Vicinamibacterales bacterium]|nr:hypothetical protein [Vicinamibacterales bacterium]